jgi:N6-adenosine-specific RNA methylase IME4
MGVPEPRAEKGTGRDAVSHYDCLDFPALARLPIADLADDDCALFLWAVDPLLDRAIDLIRAWGFAYKTVGFTWVKLNPGAKGEASFDRLNFFTGLGYWTRANPEQCLLATRGRPRRRARDVEHLVVAPRREP